MLFKLRSRPCFVLSVQFILHSIPSYPDASIMGMPLYQVEVPHDYANLTTITNYQLQQRKPVISSSRVLQGSLLRVVNERGLFLSLKKA